MATSAAACTKVHKQIESLRKKQTELLAFDEKLRHYADMRITLERRVESVLSSAKARRGQKTARMLRNGLVHRWDAGDAAEVQSRFEEIDTAIEGIFQTIRNRVVQSASS